jgi:hypothetical protein
MCDYSLQHVGNRPKSRRQARLERGFTAVGEPGVAVCLLPGTELVQRRMRARVRSLPEQEAARKV